MFDFDSPGIGFVRATAGPKAGARPGSVLSRVKMITALFNLYEERKEKLLPIYISTFLVLANSYVSRTRVDSPDWILIATAGFGEGQHYLRPNIVFWTLA